MNRVETAIQDGRCVLAVGGRALAQPEVLSELRRRNLPVVALGSDPVNPAVAPSPEALAPALQNEGGVLVLVEPDAGVDGRALAALERLIKAAPHNPRLAVVARAFNPFALPMAMRLLKFELVKKRAAEFLGLLPAGRPVTEVAAQVASSVAASNHSAVRQASSSPQRIPAPRPELVGREEELPALVELVQTRGGPIVVTGPSGSGRRWLIEAALQQADVDVLPELVFGPGVGADTLLGRIAMMAKVAGDDALHKAMSGSTRPAPNEVVELAVAALQSDAFAGKAWVIEGLDRLLSHRDGAFWRDERLELVLTGLLTHELALTVLLPAEAAPVFYREGQSHTMRRFPLGGLKGRELHELFASYQAPDFDRDRFGPIHERVHGHPMAARSFAVKVREDGDVDATLEHPRLLKSDSVADLEALKRHLKKRVEALDKEHRTALARAAHMLYAGSATELQVLNIPRNTRLQLLADGLLDQTPVKGPERRYSVHPLVSRVLTGREITDFTVMADLARHYLSRARDLKREDKLVESFAMAQEGNRLMVAARKGRDRLRLPYPDHDAVIASVREIMGRRKNPRLDIARMRVNEARKADPTSPELAIVDAELAQRENVGHDKINAIFADAAAAAPVPELFHAEANVHRGGRKARLRAAAVLERGIAAFVDDGRLHRRLGGLYLLLGKTEDAERVLRRAQEIEPMMPDTYGMLGEIHTRRGPDGWAEAEAALDEALRLAPDDAQHRARKAELLRLQALGDDDADARAAKLEESAELLRGALQADPGSWRVQMLLAWVLLDQGQDDDLEQAEWLLKKSLKAQETVEGLTARALVLLKRQALPEARQLAERARKKDGSYHPAMAVLGEIELASGDVFKAFEAYKSARERSPTWAPQRKRYEQRMQEFGALIESGAAAEMMRQAGHELVQATDAGVPDGPRRDAGSTTILRKREGEGAEQADGAEQAAPAEVAAEAAPEEGAEQSAPAEVATEAAPEEGAEQSAPAEVAAEAAPAEVSAEAAPADSAEQAAPAADAAPADSAEQAAAEAEPAS